AVTVRRTQDDRLLENVFLDGPELWDRERRRITMLLDPGRIKRGLGPHLEAGYPLEAGVSVIVRVDPEFKDAAGRPLVMAAERRYEVGQALWGLVQAERWRLRKPAVATEEPLSIAFDRPLDHALIQRCLSVRNSSGAAVPGDLEIARGETEALFTPREPW